MTTPADDCYSMVIAGQKPVTAEPTPLPTQVDLDAILRARSPSRPAA